MNINADTEISDDNDACFNECFDVCLEVQDATETEDAVALDQFCTTLDIASDKGLGKDINLGTDVETNLE